MEKGDKTVAKTPVFVSFDFDNDKTLKDFVIGQAKNSDTPFEVADHSLKEAAPESNWEAKARAAIRRAKVVLVMLGSQTYRAPGVLKEVKMAQEEGVRCVQMIGHPDRNPRSVTGAGRVYRWTHDNLAKIFGQEQWG